MIKRKDGLFQETVTINGKRKYFYGKTKAEVLKKINAFTEEKEKGRAFKKVVEDWKEEHYEYIVPSTARGYEASRKRALSCFGTTPVKEITPQQIDAFIKDLASKHYSKKVVATQLNVLNLIFNYAIRNGELMYNPCSAVRLPSGLPQQRRELPSDKDIEIVKNSDWLLPFFLLYTGLRKGEALAITYEDIDRENKLINVNKAVGYADNRPYIKTPKTKAGTRSVILLDKLAERIPEGTGLLFHNKKGELYSESQIRREWQAWQLKNNTSVTAHQLRHGYATILYEAGIELKDAQYLLGHASASMTQDVYTHIRQKKMEATAAKINAFVDSF